MLSRKISKLINRTKSHLDKILGSPKAFKSDQLIAVNLQQYSNQHINAVKISKLLGLKFVLKQYFKTLLTDLSIVSNVIFIGLEWHLYTNAKAKRTYDLLCIVHERQSFFILGHIVHFSQFVSHISYYMSVFKISLKGIRCTLYTYKNNHVHLGYAEYIAENSGSCLLKPSKQSVACLIKSIKQKLYHKNTQGYWRASSHICPSRAMLRIEEIMHLWLKHYSSTLRNWQILRLNQLADSIFYIWQMK